MPNYRILVQYDPDKSVFTARAPELEHCSAEGATRAEALTKIEEEIEAQLGNIRERGGRIPPAVEDDLSGYTGEITARVSRSLHRELAFQSRADGIELAQLLGELLGPALEARRARGVRGRPQPQGQPSAPPPGRPDDDAQPPFDRQERGNERGGNDRGGGRARYPNQGGRYHAIMEDRATFVEYVRGLEQGNAPGVGGGGDRGRRRDRDRDRGRGGDQNRGPRGPRPVGTQGQGGQGPGGQGGHGGQTGGDQGGGGNEGGGGAP